MTEKEVRKIVKSMLSKAVTDESKIKKMAKDESEKIVKKAIKDVMSSKEVKDLIKDTMLKYHRWMWEKKSMWINRI